jgi:hypothetical protein
MALLAVSPVMAVRGMPYIFKTRNIRESLLVRMLGALFMVYLDIIIDPVALRGSRWFLGQIFLIWALQKIDAVLDKKGVTDYHGHRYPWRYLIGPALYVGVLVFNLSVTFSIGEYTPGWVGVFHRPAARCRPVCSYSGESAWRRHVGSCG